MSKEELTLLVYSDYSKAFDRVQHHTIIQKLHKIGFSISVLKWFISYLGDRYVQVNNSKSATKPCHFGALQRSVLGPLLFNLYINNLQDTDPADPVNTCQYADDTTQHEHFKISQIRQTIQNTQKHLDNLNVWSQKNNLLLNSAKMKYIIFSTTKIKQSFLQDFEYSFSLNDKVEKVENWKVLGVIFQENLSWEKDIDELICSCYNRFFVLKKIKRFPPQTTRKYLAEALIILKIDYGNIIYFNASQNSLIQLQKLLKVTCSFANGCYSNSLDLILLFWLLISERIHFCIMKLTHTALYVMPFPSYLKLSFKKLSQYFQNKDEFLINNYNKNSNTFCGKACTLFNNLPYQIRGISSFKSFSKEVKKYLMKPKQNIFNIPSEPTQPYCYSNFFSSSCFTSNLENFASFS